MAEIVAGFGSSHSLILVMEPEDWVARAKFDRTISHPYRGKEYTFDELKEIRTDKDYETLCGDAQRQIHHDRNQAAIANLGDTIREVNPDVLVVIGDDQNEWYSAAMQPAITIFHGDGILNSAYDPKDHEHKHPTIQMVESKRHTPEDTLYPVASELAEHMITTAAANDFEVTSSKDMPHDKNGKPIGIGHAYTFIYRRVLQDKPITMVPILVNTYYPPNKPSPRRCFEFGKTLGKAIRSWDGNQRVALLGSGGLSHFVIDEDWDHRMLEAMSTGDFQVLVDEPDIIYRSGTSEVKNWLIMLGAISDCDFEMELIDYVPCYRSEAGTGTAMGFAAWR